MCILDEFQNFVDSTLYSALPETRQMGLQLLLSHQSFSQLEQGDVDMRGIVWQARTRAMFCNDAEDADLLAHELASLKYDPKLLKDQIETFRQRKVGQELVRLQNFNASTSKSSGQDRGYSSSRNDERSFAIQYDPRSGRRSDGASYGSTWSEKNSTTSVSTEGWSETLIDQLEDFYEVSNKTFYTFDEQMRNWARLIRTLDTGNALLKIKDDHDLYNIMVDRLLFPMTPAHVEARQRLLEENFSNRNLFIPRTEVDTTWDRFVQQLGSGALRAPNHQALMDIEEGGDDSVFS